MMDDPRIIGIRRALEQRPAAAAPRDEGRREAAVALIVRPHVQLELLLIRRAEIAGDPWSGHVALPGGRRAPADATLYATACRESAEEVGVPLKRVGTLLGALDELAPANPLLPPILIAPWVVAVPPDTQVTPDPREVAAAVWVPLDALRANTPSQVEVQHGTARRSFPAFVYDDYEIWGLTYRILEQFLSLTDA